MNRPREKKVKCYLRALHRSVVGSCDPQVAKELIWSIDAGRDPLKICLGVLHFFDALLQGRIVVERLAVCVVRQLVKEYTCTTGDS